jgi:hypothetical protein
MSVENMRQAVSQIYKTIKGKPISQVPDNQIMAIYFSMKKRGQL